MAAEEMELWNADAGQSSSDDSHQLVDAFWFVHDNVRLPHGRNVALFGP